MKYIQLARTVLLSATVISALTISYGVARAQQKFTVTDATGRQVEIKDTSRIVSIGGAVTEILYALGLGDRVVAIDQTSTYPAEVLKKPNVGYVRALSPEGVLALTPSVVIAVDDAGPPAAIDVLRNASVPLVLVPQALDEAGVLKKIRFVADAAGVREEGEKLVRALQEDFKLLAGLREKIKERRRAAFVLALGNGSPIVGGGHTTVSAIFKLAGVENAFEKFEGFKPAADEAMIAAQPDAVVMMSERNHAMTADTVFAMPAFAATPAAREKKIVSLPGLYLLGFGPRTAHAARDLAAALYPELQIAALPQRPWTADGGLKK